MNKKELEIDSPRCSDDTSVKINENEKRVMKQNQVMNLFGYSQNSKLIYCLSSIEVLYYVLAMHTLNGTSTLVVFTKIHRKRTDTESLRISYQLGSQD